MCTVPLSDRRQFPPLAVFPPPVPRFSSPGQREENPVWRNQTGRKRNVDHSRLHGGYLSERCLFLFRTLQGGEASPVSRLGLEFRGPFGKVFAENVEAQPQFPIFQGVDPRKRLPFAVSVARNQVNRLRRLARIQRELALSALAIRLDGKIVPVE